MIYQKNLTAALKVAERKIAEQDAKLVRLIYTTPKVRIGYAGSLLG